MQARESPSAMDTYGSYSDHGPEEILLDTDGEEHSVSGEASEYAASRNSRRNPLMKLMLVVLIHGATAADYGVVPAVQRVMQKDLELTDTWSGLMGSIAFTSCAIFSPIVGFMLSPPTHARSIIFAGVVLSFVGELLTALSYDPLTLVAVRFLVGIAHTPDYVYLPIWCDRNAPDGEETRWMALLQTCGPIGNIIGYAITSYAVYNLGYSWRVAISGLGIFVLLIGSNTFCMSAEDWAGQRPRTRTNTDEEKLSFCADVSKLLSYLDFWLITLSSGLFYLVGTAAEFWSIRLLSCEACFGEDAWSEASASRGFLIGVTVGPIIGMISGGPLFDYFGGYRNESRTRFICMVISCCSLLGTPFMLYPPTPLAFLVSVSGMAGIIGMIMPALTGSMINSVPTHMRALASGMYGSICNVIGFQMAPIVVGFASDYASNILVGWRLAMAPCLFLAPIFLITNWLRKYNIKYSPTSGVSGLEKDAAEGTDVADGEELTDLE